MTEDVVDLLEVVDVEDHDCNAIVSPAAPGELCTQPFVEVAVVEETGQGIGLSGHFQLNAPLRVVESEGRSVAEARYELKLLIAEGGLLAQPEDVECSLDGAPGNQGNRDERLRLNWSALHELNAWIEVRLVRKNRLPSFDRPTGDTGPKRHLFSHDLVGERVLRNDRNQQPLHFVRLVYDQGVVVEEGRQRLGDAVEEGVEALLREHLVEDLGQAPVGVEARLEVPRVPVVWVQLRPLPLFSTRICPSRAYRPPQWVT